jgi:hypothetical protein
MRLGCECGDKMKGGCEWYAHSLGVVSGVAWSTGGAA